MTTTQPPVGLVLGSALPPERLAPLARTAEEAGLARVWISEDYFFSGGISGAAVALGATDALPVGIGVVSAMSRHPALLAMEIATLDRAFPGRFLPAVGLGVPGWLGQMGLRPSAPLGAVRGCVEAVRGLLAGERLDGDLGPFRFQGVQLEHPPARPLPVHVGVSGPQMLRLAGEVADGTVLSVLSGARYVGWARERLAEGRARRDGGDGSGHPVTAFAVYSPGLDGRDALATARRTMAFYLAAGGRPGQMAEVYGVAPEVQRCIDEGGADAARHVERSAPDGWVRDLTVSGTPEQCVAAIRGLLDAGADQVALFPAVGVDLDACLLLTAEAVLPELS